MDCQAFVNPAQYGNLFQVLIHFLIGGYWQTGAVRVIGIPPFVLFKNGYRRGKQRHIACTRFLGSRYFNPGFVYPQLPLVVAAQVYR